MSSKSSLPDVKPYEHKKVLVRLEGNRKVSGVLQGYDQFMNITLRNAVDETNAETKTPLNVCVIRGSTIQNIEGLE